MAQAILQAVERRNHEIELVLLARLMLPAIQAQGGVELLGPGCDEMGRDGFQVPGHEPGEDPVGEEGDEKGLDGIGNQDRQGAIEQAPVEIRDAGHDSQAADVPVLSAVPVENVVVLLENPLVAALAPGRQDLPIIANLDHDDVAELGDARGERLELLQVAHPGGFRDAGQIAALHGVEARQDRVQIPLVLPIELDGRRDERDCGTEQDDIKDYLVFDIMRIKRPHS